MPKLHDISPIPPVRPRPATARARPTSWKTEESSSSSSIQENCRWTFTDDFHSILFQGFPLRRLQEQSLRFDELQSSEMRIMNPQPETIKMKMVNAPDNNSPRLERSTTIFCTPSSKETSIWSAALTHKSSITVSESIRSNEAFQQTQALSKARIAEHESPKNVDQFDFLKKEPIIPAYPDTLSGLMESDAVLRRIQCLRDTVRENAAAAKMEEQRLASQLHKVQADLQQAKISIQRLEDEAEVSRRELTQKLEAERAAGRRELEGIHTKTLNSFTPNLRKAASSRDIFCNFSTKEILK